MFSVVEFVDNKECGVVPNLWITNNNYCYWPTKVLNKKTLKSMIEKCLPPTPNWPKYSLKKIHHECDNLEEAEEKLNALITESESSHSEVSNLENIAPLRLKSVEFVDNKKVEKELQTERLSGNNDENEYFSDNIISNSEDSNPPEQENYVDRKQRSRSSQRNRSSSSEFSAGLDKISKRPRKARKFICKPLTDEGSQIKTSTVLTQRSTPVRSTLNYNTPTTSHQTIRPIVPQTSLRLNSDNDGSVNRRYTPTTSHQTIRPIVPQTSLRVNADNDGSVNRRFEEKVVSYLQKLVAVQEQNTAKIDQILSLVSQNKASCIQKPEQFPDLPLERKKDFREMEKMLGESVNFRYLKNRLSVIGGGTVRAVATNMLKFLLTNKLAKKFNWAGNHGKRAFKDTSLMKVIHEAVFLHFSENQSISLLDLNEKVVIKAIQDWLRLAPQRFQYNQNR